MAMPFTIAAAVSTPTCARAAACWATNAALAAFSVSLPNVTIAVDAVRIAVWKVDAP